MRRSILFLATALLIAAFCSLGAAEPFYIEIEGIPGECQEPGHEDQIEGLSFHHEISIPAERTTGRRRGNKQHSPVTFTKLWDKATPKLHEFCAKNTKIGFVKFSFYRLGGDQRPEMYFTIELEQVLIVKVKKFKDRDKLTGDAGGMFYPEVEEISMTFEEIKLTWHSREGKVECNDTWSE